MKYGIVVNPVAGKLNFNKKKHILKQVLDILDSDCVVAGLDTESPIEFCNCARELAEKVDILIVAGGDGTVSDVINSVDSEVVLSYLPLGSGSALQHTLNLPRSIPRIAEKIRDGRERSLDLILCDDDKKAMFASVGIDGHILMERAKYLQQGVVGLKAYARATIKSLFWGYERVDATVTIDGETFDVPEALFIIITKVPYYGYGLKIVPRAKPDDGYLHLLSVSSGQFGVIYGLATSFLGGNRIGEYRIGRYIHITTTKELSLQIDGTLGKKGTDFKFEVLPGQLKIRY